MKESTTETIGKLVTTLLIALILFGVGSCKVWWCRNGHPDASVLWCLLERK